MSGQPTRAVSAGAAANVSIAVLDCDFVSNAANGLNFDTSLVGFFTTGGGGGMALFVGDFAVVAAASITVVDVSMISNSAGMHSLCRIDIVTVAVAVLPLVPAMA